MKMLALGLLAAVIAIMAGSLRDSMLIGRLEGRCDVLSNRIYRLEIKALFVTNSTDVYYPMPITARTIVTNKPEPMTWTSDTVTIEFDK